ncbi:UDP-glucose/GDP-mannose dehydrogenase family protein, partial [candidate division WOR-3 bacterium]|nr:UDP-glucose/GDP-mannose dehydrogenase family protein [candidate division WOR-3 bacterium]
MSEKICVIGTGYVGLVTAIGLSDFGNHIIGVDVDTTKIENLKKGISPIYEPGIEEYLLRNLKSKRLEFSNNIEESIRKSTVIFIGVGTPSLKSGEADLSQVISVADTIAENLNEYKVIVTKSTVPVGTNQMIIDRIRSKTDKSFDVVSNPEFLREGKAIIDFFNPDRVIIGYTSDRARKIMEDVYRALRINQTPFVWCNLETAELIKYASNAFLATKITF